MNEETTVIPASATPAGPGALLAARREELNWSVEQVASHLNLAPRQVRAIEADDFSVLPVMAITRGFIRSYAKLLGLEAAPLLAMIASEPGAPEPELAPRARLAPTTFSANSSGITWKRRASKKPWLIGLLLLAAVAAGAAYQFGWLPFGHEALSARGNEGLARFPHVGAQAPETAEPSEPGLVSHEIAPPQIAATEGAAPPDAPAPAAVPEAPAPAKAQAQAPAQAQAQAAPAATPAVPAPAVAAKPEVAAGNVLVLTLREESWVEVRPAGKPALVARVLPAGSSETFKLDEPFVLVVGNASGVEASLRGQTLDLKSKAKNNVARLSLK